MERPTTAITRPAISGGKQKAEPAQHGRYGNLQDARDSGHPKHQRQASDLRCRKGRNQVDLCVAGGAQVTAADKPAFCTQQQRPYGQSQHRKRNKIDQLVRRQMHFSTEDCGIE